jgi:prepilin-type N-terminal cleavage/methylation domain-containing protein
MELSYRSHSRGFTLLEVAAALALLLPLLLLANGALLRFQRHMSVYLTQAQLPEIRLGLVRYLRDRPVELDDGEELQLTWLRGDDGSIAMREITADERCTGRLLLNRYGGSVLRCTFIQEEMVRSFLLAPALEVQ